MNYIKIARLIGDQSLNTCNSIINKKIPTHVKGETAKKNQNKWEKILKKAIKEKDHIEDIMKSISLFKGFKLKRLLMLLENKIFILKCNIYLANNYVESSIEVEYIEDYSWIEKSKTNAKVRKLNTNEIPESELESFIDYSILQDQGIYFITLKNNIVYIGQSNNFQRRIAEHWHSGKLSAYKFNDKDIGFNFFNVPTTNPKILNTVEQDFIIKHNPIWNKINKVPNSFLTPPYFGDFAINEHNSLVVEYDGRGKAFTNKKPSSYLVGLSGNFKHHNRDELLKEISKKGFKISNDPYSSKINLWILSNSCSIGYKKLKIIKKTDEVILENGIKLLLDR